jgi:hypothetical protein
LVTVRQSTVVRAAARIRFETLLTDANMSQDNQQPQQAVDRSDNRDSGAEAAAVADASDNSTEGDEA